MSDRVQEFLQKQGHCYDMRDLPAARRRRLCPEARAIPANELGTLWDRMSPEERTQLLDLSYGSQGDS